MHEKIELEQKLVRGEIMIKEKNELLLIHVEKSGTCNDVWYDRSWGRSFHEIEAQHHLEAELHNNFSVIQ